MKKRKCLIFLFCLILCYSLFQYIARAQSSSSHGISSQGEITYSPLNVNLAVIPDHWAVTGGYASGYPNVYVDYHFVRTSGKPSIRIEPHTSADTNFARECDGKWYPVKPGDHIIAKIWIKIDSLAGYTYDPTNPWNWRGARLGFDAYAPDPDNPGYVIVPWNSGILLGDQVPYQYVEWNTSGWVQKSYDFTVPSDFFTKDLFTGRTLSRGVQISSLVLWMQVVFANDPANAWFADAELYINP